MSSIRARKDLLRPVRLALFCWLMKWIRNGIINWLNSPAVWLLVWFVWMNWFHWLKTFNHEINEFIKPNNQLGELIKLITDGKSKKTKLTDVSQFSFIDFRIIITVNWNWKWGYKYTEAELKLKFHEIAGFINHSILISFHQISFKLHYRKWSWIQFMNEMRLMIEWNNRQFVKLFIGLSG